MSQIQTGWKDLSYQQPGDPLLASQADFATARDEDVMEVLGADPHDEDGRSQWLRIRFPNGDLMLGTFPQGETYIGLEEGVHRSFQGDAREC